MTAVLAPHRLSGQQVRLLEHIAADATTRTIAADPELPWERTEVDAAVTALLSATGTRTASQLAAWATAYRIITDTAQPHTVLAPDIRLPRRLRRVLAGWVGGRTAPELAADIGIATTTVRSYGRDLRAWLGVRSQVQASIAAVLAGLVLLSDIDPAWPAEPLHHAASRSQAA
ncbi:LuxR C-terminal-related transcriptional regulator [Kitasatospora sp. NPDC098663]|uniref:LuxR C-terminal-related transcriptional regulator n=1 Tax=Kitasatospora sp. NPDC098663 TaxID=3364096 RepID=UPI00382AAB1A